MLNLRYQFNSCMTSLPEFGPIKHAVVPVLLKDGDFRRVKWAGYKELDDVRESLLVIKNVKLDVVAFSVAPGELPRWRPVPEGMAVRGCVTDQGAFCVVALGMPIFIQR